MKTRPKFTEPEIELFNNADLDAAKVDFDKLHKRVVAGKQLTELEKTFFCKYIPTFLPNSKAEDFPECADFRFKTTYIWYWQDLTGGIKYFKPVSLTTEDLSSFDLDEVKQNPAKYKREVGAQEAQADLAYLESEAHSWYKKMQASNPGDSLYCAKVETDEQIRQLDEQPEFKNDFYMKGTIKYRLIKRGIILQSKYAYLMMKEEVEKLDKADLFFTLNGIDIELTECTILHILFRHYSALTKKYNTGKSFHNTDFHYRKLPEQLRSMLKKIEDSGLYKNDSVAKISINYNGVPYCIRTGDVLQRQVAGQTMPFVRIQTFYPVEDLDELNTLKTDYKVVSLSGGLELFSKK
ncbi:MAG TPA: hypothetical protein VG603_11690 [Chitinophagales bacterium]|nr:hypothetical protein [Chitinophagales bacterium]